MSTKKSTNQINQRRFINNISWLKQDMFLLHHIYIYLPWYFCLEARCWKTQLEPIKSDILRLFLKWNSAHQIFPLLASRSFLFLQRKHFGNVVVIIISEVIIERDTRSCLHDCNNKFLLCSVSRSAWYGPSFTSSSGPSCSSSPFTPSPWCVASAWPSCWPASPSISLECTGKTSRSVSTPSLVS